MSVEAIGAAIAAGRIGKMSPKHLAILDLLLRHDFVNEELLAKTAWHGEDRPADNILSVYVSKLRAILEPLDVAVGRQRGLGWFISPEHRDRIMDIMAGKIIVPAARPEPPPLEDDPNFEPLNGGPRRTVELPGGTRVILESDHPIPSHGDSRRIYAFAEMRVGESQLVEGKAKNSIQSAIQGYRNSHPDNKSKQFVVREVGAKGDKVCRIWRSR